MKSTLFQAQNAYSAVSSANFTMQAGCIRVPDQLSSTLFNKWHAYNVHILCNINDNSNLIYILCCLTCCIGKDRLIRLIDSFPIITASGCSYFPAWYSQNSFKDESPYWHFWGKFQTILWHFFSQSNVPEVVKKVQWLWYYTHGFVMLIAVTPTINKKTYYPNPYYYIMYYIKYFYIDCKIAKRVLLYRCGTCLPSTAIVTFVKRCHLKT